MTVARYIYIYIYIYIYRRRDILKCTYTCVFSQALSQMCFGENQQDNMMISISHVSH